MLVPAFLFADRKRGVADLQCRHPLSRAVCDLLLLLWDSPDPDLALTDPALFQALRDAGTKAFVSGICSLRVVEQI